MNGLPCFLYQRVSGVLLLILLICSVPLRGLRPALIWSWDEGPRKREQQEQPTTAVVQHVCTKGLLAVQAPGKRGKVGLVVLKDMSLSWISYGELRCFGNSGPEYWSTDIKPLAMSSCETVWRFSNLLFCFFFFFFKKISELQALNELVDVHYNLCKCWKNSQQINTMDAS